MNRTVKIIIHGRVQGVFFRKYTLMAAEKFRISGYVWNNYDETVVIEASGSAADIKDFISWCHKGSPLSKVSKVEVEEMPEAEFDGFTIRH